MNGRKHYFDACRALLMALGIPFHAALIYQHSGNWMIASDAQSQLLTDFARWIQTFRMPAFFVIAGYFAWVSIRQRSRTAWLRARAVRLGVPLLTVALVLSPVQVFISECVRATQPWHLCANAAVMRTIGRLTSSGYDWVLHLWFLVDLMLYSAVLAVSLRLSQLGCFARARRVVDGGARYKALLAAVVLSSAGVAAVVVWAMGRERFVFGGVIDFARLSAFAPFFALGVILARRPELLEMMTRKSWTAGLAALACSAVSVFAARIPAPSGPIVRFLLFPVTGVLMAQLLMALARRFANTSNRLVAFGADSAFTVYLLHHPIVLSLGALFLRVQWNPILEWGLIVAIAAVLSSGAHLVVRGSDAMVFLLNGTRNRRPERAAVVAQGA